MKRIFNITIKLNHILSIRPICRTNTDCWCGHFSMNNNDISEMAKTK